MASILFVTVTAALGQSMSVPSGVPLRVVLERRVPIQHVGDPIQGRLIESIYVFDRVVLPAGSLVEGHIAEIGGVPASRRLQATLSGNLTPPRDVRAQFDTLVLRDGSRLTLHTSLSGGMPHPVRVAPKRKKQDGPKSTVQNARDKVEDAAIRAFTAPDKWSRLKSRLIGMLPYHRQAWSSGTLFNSVLQQPLTAPSLNQPEPATSEGQEVTARLLHPINSRTSARGEPVRAIVTRPLFSTNHTLVIPEGTLLFGDVVSVKPARFLHRNGAVQFVFRQIQPPASAVQSIQGYLGGVEANFESHLALDSEGSIRSSSPKTRFIFPALAVAAAGLSFHQDYDAQGVADFDIAGRAEAGAVGLGLIGTVIAQTSRTLASGIAITGAGFSIYSTFLKRGQDVVLPVNTHVKVNLKQRFSEVWRSRPKK